MKRYDSFTEWKKACKKIADESNSSVVITSSAEGGSVAVAKNGLQSLRIGMWTGSMEEGHGTVFKPERDNLRLG
jgi:hypothetical protein